MSTNLRKRSNKESKMSNDSKNNIKQNKRLFEEKVFQNRNSLLTDMFLDPNYNSIFNMFISFIILLFLMTVSQDWIERGIFNHFHHLDWVAREFANPGLVISLLLFMYLCYCSVFLITKSWLRMNERFNYNITLINYLYYGLYISILLLLIIIPILIVYQIYIPPCSNAFVVYEQIRLIMKCHAFVRSICRQGHNTKSNKLNFKHYCYFMIIPTLVYRDEYPKREKRSWRLIIWWAIQFILCVIFIYYIFTIMIRDNFINFQPKMSELNNLIPLFFRSLLPTILMIFVMFYCVLHVWMNLFAEITCFGDRLFYKDWWNSTSLGHYYRTWNNVVHDWLYNYIYIDISSFIYRLTKNVALSKSIGTIVVILISALVHEYVLAFCFRFFYPVLLIVFFGLGTLLYFFKVNRATHQANICFWLGIFIGNAIFVTFYASEWYARRNCLKTIDGWMDFVIPRSLNCQLK